MEIPVSGVEPAAAPLSHSRLLMGLIRQDESLILVIDAAGIMALEGAGFTIKEEADGETRRQEVGEKEEHTKVQHNADQ
jgi:hypothetical protein